MIGQAGARHKYRLCLYRLRARAGRL